MTERYDMPASFGPSAMPARTTVEGAVVAICAFETDPEALAPLLPPHLDPGDAPICNISMIHYPSTDYMGGRGYNEVLILVPARHRGQDGEMAASFAPVLWVDQFGALAAGREFQGLPKLLADIDLGGQPDCGMVFGVSEYGNDLLRGKLADLSPLPPEKMEGVRKAGAAVATFGWKYIPSPTGGADADYATVNYTRWSYDQCWTGSGSVEFRQPSAKEAPFGSRVMAVLGALPVHRWRRAFVGRGTVVIDRTMTRRLVK